MMPHLCLIPAGESGIDHAVHVKIQRGLFFVLFKK
jgi:hypothetical protein